MSTVQTQDPLYRRRSIGLGGAIQARIQRHALLRGAAPAMRYRRGRAWTSLSWAELGQVVDIAARGLATAGVQPADKVVVVGRRSPAALVAAFAVRAAGAVPVLVPAEADAAAFARLSRLTGATATIVENRADAARATAAGALRLHGTVPTDPADLLPEQVAASPFGVLYDAAARFAGGPAFFAVRLAEDGAIDVERVTGSTLATEIVPLLDVAPVGPADVLFVLEPLSSPATHGAIVSAWMDSGATLAFPAADDSLIDDLASVSPTAMFASGRGVALFVDRLAGDLAAAPAWRRRLAEVGLPALSRRLRSSVGRRATAGERLARLLVAGGLRRRIGLGRLRTFAIVGDPLTPRLAAFVAEIGLRPVAGAVSPLLGPTEARPTRPRTALA